MTDPTLYVTVYFLAMALSSIFGTCLVLWSEAKETDHV